MGTSSDSEQKKEENDKQEEKDEKKDENNGEEKAKDNDENKQEDNGEEKEGEEEDINEPKKDVKKEEEQIKEDDDEEEEEESKKEKDEINNIEKLDIIDIDKDKDLDNNEEKENKQQNENKKKEKKEPSLSVDSKDDFFNKLIFSKYKPVKKLGEGSFGKVYKAEYNSQYYAIKFEDREDGQDLLQNEATIMSYLKGNPHIPKVRSYGFKGNYNILVMQLLDKSLEDIFNIRKKFSFKTGAMLAYQMISVLEYIHEKHIIHRDIKPDNFVLGSGELNAYLYLVDFGLAKKYRSSKTLTHYPYIKKKKLTGTARYASIHAMEEMEQSRRDDLEAVGYVIMYFIRGNLPWQGLKLKSNEDRYKKILEKKKEVSTLELCMDCPRVFFEYVNYTKKLGYTEQPRYDLFKNKFVDFVVNQSKLKFDYIFDWTTEIDIKKRKEQFNITCPPLDQNNYKLTLNDENNKKNDEENNKENNIENLEEIKEENIEEEDNKKNENENENENEKVETACCIMQVNILFIFYILYSF